MGRTPEGTVKETGSPAQAILVGATPHNQGMRIRVQRAQSAGSGGRIEGPFDLLEAGTSSEYSYYMKAFEGKTFLSAKQFLEKVFPAGSKATHLLNRNCLRLLDEEALEKPRRIQMGEGRQAASTAKDLPNIKWIEGLIRRLKAEGKVTMRGKVSPEVLKKEILSRYYEAQNKRPPQQWWEDILRMI